MSPALATAEIAPLTFFRRPATHLAELVPSIMETYALSPSLSPLEVLAALRKIAAYSDKRSRWLAAFASPLGRVIASRGVDLNTALATIVAQLPDKSA